MQSLQERVHFYFDSFLQKHNFIFHSHKAMRHLDLEVISYISDTMSICFSREKTHFSVEIGTSKDYDSREPKFMMNLDYFLDFIEMDKFQNISNVNNYLQIEKNLELNFSAIQSFITRPGLKKRYLDYEKNLQQWLDKQGSSYKSCMLNNFYLNVKTCFGSILTKNGLHLQKHVRDGLFGNESVTYSSDAFSICFSREKSLEIIEVGPLEIKSDPENNLFVNLQYLLNLIEYHDIRVIGEMQTYTKLRTRLKENFSEVKSFVTESGKDLRLLRLNNQVEEWMFENLDSNESCDIDWVDIPEC